jgi:hypothetical protein
MRKARFQNTLMETHAEEDPEGRRLGVANKRNASHA